MDEFTGQIYAQVHQIPEGMVATYGDIAKMAGYPGYARHVGRLMGSLPAGSSLPWHRVINAKGMISLTGDGFERQRQRLIDEGVEVSPQGKLSLRRYRWKNEL